MIPTRNRQREARNQVLASLKAVNPHGGAVVLVDDNSEPPVDLDALWRLHPNVLQLRTARRMGTSAARNLGVSLSPPDALIVEVDDHDYVEPGAVDAVLDAFADRAVHAVYGDEVRGQSRIVIEKPDYRPGLFRWERPYTTGLRAYRKSLWLRVGGYRVDEFPAGDYGFFLRAELALKDRGIKRIPKVLVWTNSDPCGLSTMYGPEQSENARNLIDLARSGMLDLPTMSQAATA